MYLPTGQDRLGEMLNWSQIHVQEVYPTENVEDYQQKTQIRPKKGKSESNISIVLHLFSSLIGDS